MFCFTLTKHCILTDTNGSTVRTAASAAWSSSMRTWPCLSLSLACLLPHPPPRHRLWLWVRLMCLQCCTRQRIMASASLRCPVGCFASSWRRGRWVSVLKSIHVPVSVWLFVLSFFHPFRFRDSAKLFLDTHTHTHTHTHTRTHTHTLSLSRLIFSFLEYFDHTFNAHTHTHTHTQTPRCRK